MCIICKEWTKGKLTAKEAFNAIGETLNSGVDQKTIEHVNDLIDQILEKELNENN